jgi:hypothetical protein
VAGYLLWITVVRTIEVATNRRTEKRSTDISVSIEVPKPKKLIVTVVALGGGEGVRIFRLMGLPFVVDVDDGKSRLLDTQLWIEVVFDCVDGWFRLRRLQTYLLARWWLSA